MEDKYGKRHDYFVPADEKKAAGRRPNTNIIPGTHGTLEFVADLATDAFPANVNFRITA